MYFIINFIALIYYKSKQYLKNIKIIMEFTDLKELKKLMAGSVNKFAFEEDPEIGSYDKSLMYSYPD